MNLSLNEWEALAKKALRGAGLPWGVAEVAAKLSRTAVVKDHKIVEDLADWVALCDIQSMSGPKAVYQDTIRPAKPAKFLCPILTGIAIWDAEYSSSDLHGLNFENLVFPRLLGMFIDSIVSQPLAQNRSEFVGCTFDQDAHAQGNNVTVYLMPEKTCHAPRELASRLDLTPDLHQLFASYALRTYAPATEASRLLGAGAGLTDNE